MSNGSRLLEELSFDELDTYIANNSLSDIFRAKRYQLQDYESTGKRKYYPWQEIEKLVGLSKDIIRKKLQLSRSMTRDCLIAICAAHGMDATETSMILLKCGMHRLDEELPRDYVIIGALVDRGDNELGSPVSVVAINEKLKENGYPELEVRERTVHRKTTHDHDLPYSIIREYSQTFFDDGDQYDSLSTAYDFRYECNAIGIIQLENGSRVSMRANAKGRCELSMENDEELYKQSCIYSEAEAKELAPYYMRLVEKARSKQRDLYAILDDTKNYKHRLSAKLRDDRIHVFYEEFDFQNPEMNEYFLMEYIGGCYRLSIAHCSLFMQHYLTQREYTLNYGISTVTKVEQYCSEKEIIGLIETAVSVYSRERMKKLQKVYLRLQKKVAACLDQLRDGELFVNNLDAIWDNPWEVLRYYSVEKEFDVEYDTDYGQIVNAKDTAEILNDDGTKVEMTIEILSRAFQLGFENIHQICRVLVADGSVEAVLR